MVAAPGSRLLWALLSPLLSLCPAGSRGEGLSLHPPYFNLAAVASISATATCGEAAEGGGQPELYCKLVGGPAAAPLGHAIQGQFCDYCNAAEPGRAHPVTNAIDGTESWWQSPPLSRGLRYNEVNVTLELGQLFHVAYILIKFANSPRPDLWVLERSVDFGRSYSPWQYFAQSKADCLELFGKEANVPVRRDKDVLCTTEYSRVLPLENGEIVVSLVNGRPGAANFSGSLREFTQATSIRLRLLRTNTLLGHLLSKAQRDPTVTRRYYYSIKDISIGGRCVCHGHAEVCNARRAGNQYQFQCECQHHSCGQSCGQCCPGYHQKQWRPAAAGSTNACEPCNCHGHATDCYYDADVDRRGESLNVHGRYEGGGVCINCQHNTAGVNCEKCAEGYYRPRGVPATARHGCRRIAAHPSPNPQDAMAGNIRACHCDVRGTLSGVGECQQANGHCYCKANVWGGSCDTCQAGFHALQDKNYFGCQGCWCDVGASLSPRCAAPWGGCQCRAHVVGTSCQEPEKDYFFPDLHHMKYEVEDGSTAQGVGVRFGYDPQEFPGFSWRGYAQMSSLQSEVRLAVTVARPQLSSLRLVLRYRSAGAEAVPGRLSAGQAHPATGAAQIKEFVFPPSKEPAFITIPGNSSAEPFSLAPGTWTVSIMAEEVLLDYLVLLPSDYYEASILQVQVTEPCSPSGDTSTEHCLLYQHLPLGRFSCVLGSEAAYFRRGRDFRRLPLQQPTPDQPVLAQISGREVHVEMAIKVPWVGRYVLVFEYANQEDQLYTAQVEIQSSGPVTKGRVRIYSCKYSFLCRSAVVDAGDRVAASDLRAGTARIQLTAAALHLLLHKVCIIPAEEFSPEYVDPKVQCTAAYSRTHAGSATCIPSVYETPSAALVLDAFKDGRISEAQRNALHEPQSASFPSGSLPGVLLTPSQEQVTWRGRVPLLGRYVFVVHFSQAAHPTFPVQVQLDVGRVWSGSFSASFCPHASGCRGQVTADHQTEFEVSEHEVSVTVLIPDGRMLLLAKLLVVPADTYSYKILETKAVDKSFDFISQCGGNSFALDLNSPEGSSAFCRDSVKSLVAFYNNGALPCNCHSSGAMSPTCSPLGGQCLCRANVIGRQCSRCRTGYYGFPFCKACRCGQHLCDEVTGECLCPPRTLPPRCELCEHLSYSYHPVAGCQSCNCSARGVVNVASPECDKVSGQCRCRPGVGGRQCDQCAPGTYGFPSCRPCSCNRDGTEPDVCDPQTGICLCKENVEGAKCDTCRPGSFFLDPSNPRGCSSCFCFGATSECRSSTRRRATFVDMRNWSLEAVDENLDIPVSFNPVSNSVVADVQELPASVQSLYWRAPPSYLGQKLSSYGGFLSYQVKSFGLPSEGMALLDKRPDVQLTGQQMKVVYEDPSTPQPDRLYHGRVQLVEGNFRHASSSHLVSREELMLVLSSLEGLHIRGLYFSETQRLTLAEVGLEEASSTGSGSVARSVESCSCPPGYSGDSCQDCGPGFYRASTASLAGHCVPCSCNGNSDRCQDGTGKCLSCQHHTAGQRCERCEEGYFGDATQGSCRVCPCPYTNRFATGCVVNGEEIQCLCKEGYAGARCERCAPGYFGNPQKYGGYCQKCNCDSNGQLASCDHLTGECFNNDPKDVDPNEDCDPCDSCVMTLLKDLSTMGDELQLIKSQLQTVHRSSHTLEQMRRLEAHIQDLKVSLDTFRSGVRSQGLKVDELEAEFSNLNHDVNALQEKAEMNYKEAELLFNNFGQTHQKGKDLVSRVQILVKNIQVLLEQAAGTSPEGNSLPLGDAALRLAEAQRLLAEMRSRNLGQAQAEAEKERAEAQRLLARIKNQLQKYHQENQGLIKMVRDSLAGYESKISDLQEALTQATGQIKQAENLNRDNGVLLEDIKKRIEETNVQQEGILAALSSARSSLTQATSVLGLLQKSKEEYESLAAQLDGARKDMNAKLTNQSLSASKEPLVVRAEEHAKALEDLAKQLENIKNSYRKDELVGCAVEASTAYDNIINAIKAAEEAASKAGNAADSALLTVKREDLSGKAAKLKTESRALLDQAQETERTLKALGPNLEDIKQRLEAADGKKNSLQVDLVTLQNNLNGINRDDINNIITSAKSTIESAKDVTTNVLDELLPIQEDVEEIKSSYGSTQSAGFSKALMEANNSVKKLTNKLPDLFSKIESINQQLVPMSNISENLNHIRELIQQARDAANKVAIPMRFNGSSGVEVRPPSNLEDLRGYTSLSFFLQRPKPRSDTPQRASNKFVLYLGDKDASKGYIGMAVKGGRLSCVCNLGEGDVEVDVQPLVTESESEEAIMDQVKFERIYQYVKLNYIKAATSTAPVHGRALTASSGGSDTLLNLDPSTVVFYVGGYPPDFRPPAKLDYAHYEGCIELDSLNENVVSLYNFKRTFNLNTTEVQPCRRYKEETDQSYFEGSGYASVAVREPNTQSPVRYEQTIESTADEGIVFFAARGDQFISVLIKDGHIVFRYKIGSEPPKEIESNATVNDGTYKQIHLVLARSRNTVHVSHSIGAKIKVFIFTKYYLGGIPPALRERFNISTPPFRGCMKNVKNPSTASVVFDETVGVSKKCSEDWKLIRSAAFSRRGTLSLSAAGFPFPKDFQVGFGFQTLASTGTLLNYNLWPNILTIYLRPGSVTAKVGEKEISLEQNYEDGSVHYVTVIKADNRAHLLVDDKAAAAAVDFPRARALVQPITFGGDGFEGCISNIFIKRTGQLPEVQNLVNYTAKSGVSLGACRGAQSLQPLLLKDLRTYPRVNMLKDENSLEYLRAAHVQLQPSSSSPAHFNLSSEALLLGNSPNSSIAYMFSPPAATDRLHLSVEVRTRSSRGSILFLQGASEASPLALYISKGHFVASLGAGGHRVKIRSSAQHSDGRWHTVLLSLAGRSLRLAVDGLRAQHRTLPASSALSFEPPLYVGGLPWLQKQNMPTNSFKGCLKNLKMNGEILKAPQQKHDVLPCLDVAMDTGIYFFDEGGYITLGNLLLGLDFRVVFSIRPRSPAGTLLHTGSKQGTYLTVYLGGGKVIVAGNHGAGEFQTSVTPKQPLSDGQWHTIAVSQKENVVQLEVGTQSNSTTGPPPSRPARGQQPLYFGKIPAPLGTLWPAAPGPFSGCLRGAHLNGRPVSPRRTAEAQGAVSLQGCPAE